MTKIALVLITLAGVFAFGSASVSLAASGEGSGSRYSAYGGNTGDQNNSYNDHGAGNYQCRRC